MHIRPATVDDAEAVAALVHSAYRADESRLGWTTEADLVGGQRADATMVRALAADPAGVVLVGVREGDGLLACCHLERRATSAYLGMFAVRPGLQGQGLGRVMVDAAERQAREWGVAELRLSVLDRRRELIAWYERRGFVLTGDEEPFPYGDDRFGRPFHDDLRLLGMVRPIAD